MVQTMQNLEIQMPSFNRTEAHFGLIQCAEEIYHAASVTNDSAAHALEIITEAREALTPKAFALWVVSELGSGGKTGGDGYVVGNVPTAMRKRGMLAQAKMQEGDAPDLSADALNTFLSRLRTIGHKAAKSAAFEFAATFRKTYSKACAKGKGSNRAGTGKASKKKATVPSDAEVVNLPALKRFMESHFATALEMAEQIMVTRKDTIRAKILHDLRNALVAAA